MQRFVSVKAMTLMSSPNLVNILAIKIATLATITAAPRATVTANPAYTVKSIGTVSSGTSIVAAYPKSTGTP